MNRPDMRDYFKAQIDYEVNGMFARTIARLPNDVRRVSGKVTDNRIVVTMNDGTEWVWEGGRYASRKVNSCYSPLMPKPVK